MSLQPLAISIPAPGEPPEVTVGGQKVPGVTGIYLRLAEGALPTVGLELRPGTVAAELPASVSVAGGPSVTSFVANIDPEQLEHDILAQFDGGLAGSTGAAAKAVLAQYAADYSS